MTWKWFPSPPSAHGLLFWHWLSGQVSVTLRHQKGPTYALLNYDSECRTLDFSPTTSWFALPLVGHSLGAAARVPSASKGPPFLVLAQPWCLQTAARSSQQILLQHWPSSPENFYHCPSPPRKGVSLKEDPYDNLGGLWLYTEQFIEGKTMEVLLSRCFWSDLFSLPVKEWKGRLQRRNHGHSKQNEQLKKDIYWGEEMYTCSRHTEKKALSEEMGQSVQELKTQSLKGLCFVF